ncbi:MAG: rhodanese-like domain-containing protein [Bacteroidetes bacterium]|nr:rhodanese-like domain-containing protein [Bacteroidota bacterium]
MHYNHKQERSIYNSSHRGLSTPPVYFPVNAALNKNGYENIDNIMNKGLTALSIEAFKKEIEDDAIILDTRNATEFTQGFIPNAISIGLEGRFAEWAGVLLPFHHKLVLVTDIGKEERNHYPINACRFRPDYRLFSG